MKPTGLMSCRMPFLQKILRNHLLDDAVKPQVGAIGLSADGTFKTSHLKEYPQKLCEGWHAPLVSICALLFVLDEFVLMLSGWPMRLSLFPLELGSQGRLKPVPISVMMHNGFQITSLVHHEYVFCTN